jgi:hypothetical protein
MPPMDGRGESDLFERRKHPRVAKRIRLRWQRVATSDGAALKVGPVEAAHTRDVSKGGLGFPVAHEIEVGTILSIELDREFGGPPLSALARVARCARDEKGLYVGVEFTWIECAVPETTLGLSPENAWTLL